MKAFLCLVMTALILNVPAFAGEVWVLDLDAGPVVVNEDGSTEVWEPSEDLLEEDFVEDEPVAEDPVAEPLDEPAAEDPVVEAPEPDPGIEDPEPDSGEDPVEEPAVEDPIVEDPVEEDPADLLEEPSYDEYEEESYPSYAVMSLDEEDPAVASDPEERTMKDVVVMVLGEYSPRTQTVTQYLSDGSSDSYTEIVPGVAGMDWEWISGAALFGIVLFSFFKFVGVLLRNG